MADLPDSVSAAEDGDTEGDAIVARAHTFRTLQCILGGDESNACTHADLGAKTAGLHCASPLKEVFALGCRDVRDRDPAQNDFVAF